MQTTYGDSGGPVAAPRSGAPGSAPFLDKECINVPNRYRPLWSRKHFLARRKVLDRMRLWQASGHQCLWVTLTSAPNSTAKRLRQHFQVLRKRVSRELGYDAFDYVCVDTREGHGVLHMIWAWRDPNPLKRSSFYIEFKWLQDAWKAIHGAFHVNVKRIGGRDQDARRLSRYLVSQYCGDQDALVRISQSRMEVSIPTMRSALLREMRGMSAKYVLAQVVLAGVAKEDFGKAFNRWFWDEFRGAWDQLLRQGWCEPFGVQLAWLCGSLVRV